MDPLAERWPHVDIVRVELQQLRAEMTVSEQKVRNAHYAELKQAMAGYDKTRSRIEREQGKRDVRKYRRAERLLRRRSVSNFTQVMLEKGAQIVERLENGGAITN